MPAQVSWHDKDMALLHMVVEGEWLVSEWLSTAQQASDLADTVDQPMCLILEYRITPQYRAPGLLRNLHKVLTSPIATNTRIIRVFTFGEQGFQKNARNIFLRLYKLNKACYVDTWDEALEEAKACLAKR